MPKFYDSQDGFFLRALAEGYVDVDPIEGAVYQIKSRDGERIARTRIDQYSEKRDKNEARLSVPTNWGTKQGGIVSLAAQRMVWLAVNGPMPNSQQFVTTKDGDNRNASIDNLVTGSLRNRPQGMIERSAAKISASRKATAVRAPKDNTARLRRMLNSNDRLLREVAENELKRIEDAKMTIEATAKEVKVTLPPKPQLSEWETAYEKREEKAYRLEAGTEACDYGVPSTTGWRKQPAPNGNKPNGVLVGQGPCPQCAGVAGMFVEAKWGEATGSISYRALGNVEVNRVITECLTGIARADDATARELRAMAVRALAVAEKGA